jgi:Glycosyl transferase family 2
MEPAPICIFTYKRLDTASRTIEALIKNPLAEKSTVFIFSDGPKRETDAVQVAEVRKYLDKVKGFKEINLIKREQNFGLSKSIINGVSKVMQDFGKAIVVEDDIFTSPGFLSFINQGLEVYQDNPKVFAVSGYTFPIKYPADYQYDVYFAPRASCWGWGSWQDRWERIDWELKDYEALKSNPKLIRELNQGGSDLSRLVRRQMEGKIDSWDTVWTYNQFKFRQQAAFPTESKVQNIGFGTDATHTKFYNRFHTELDKSGKMEFNFPKDVVLEKSILQAFKNKNSLFARALGRLKFYLGFKNKTV